MRVGNEVYADLSISSPILLKNNKELCHNENQTMDGIDVCSKMGKLLIRDVRAVLA